MCRNAFSAGLHEIVDSGRKFLLVVPGTLPAPPAQVPVIIDWHGFTESPHYQNKLTGMAEAAERYGWYAVIPFGTPPRPTDTCCPDDCDEECCQNGRALDPSNACSWNSGSGGCCGAAVEANVDDVQFARDLVEWLSQNTCADTGENVFSTGFSNGAMFSNRLGCEAADLFKVRKRIFLRHFILKMIILPRQARDKHEENSKKKWRFPRNTTATLLTARIGRATTCRQPSLDGSSAVPPLS